MLHEFVMKNFKVWKKLMLLGVVFLIPALAVILALVLQRQWEQIYQAIAIGAAGFVLVCLLAFALMRDITRPLGELAATARAIADGDSTAKVTLEPRGDEIGDLAEALQHMLSAQR